MAFARQSGLELLQRTWLQGLAARTAFHVRLRLCSPLQPIPAGKKEGLPLHSQTVQAVAKSLQPPRQCRQVKLNGAGQGAKRSLGWIPSSRARSVSQRPGVSRRQAAGSVGQYGLSKYRLVGFDQRRRARALVLNVTLKVQRHPDSHCGDRQGRRTGSESAPCATSDACCSSLNSIIETRREDAPGAAGGRRPNACAHSARKPRTVARISITSTPQALVRKYDAIFVGH